MYKPDTILVLKQQRTQYDDDGEPVTDDDGNPIIFPYDRVRVIGQSPVNHADITTEWVGAHGQGVIVEPLSGFGSNLDEPFGRLQELYEVESMPEPTVMRAEDQVKVVKPEDLPPSPEEIFSNETEAQGKDSRRAKPRRFLPSPLVETPPDPEAEAEKERVKRETARRAGVELGDEDEPQAD
jgi:hypothetical protein